MKLCFRLATSLQDMGALSRLYCLPFIICYFPNTRNQDCITVSYSCGRTLPHPDTGHSSSGCSSTTLPICTTVHGDQTFVEFSGCASNFNSCCAPTHQDYPFDHIVKGLATERDMSPEPGFRQHVHVFGILHDQRRRASLFSREYLDPGTSKFDLSLEIMVDQDRLDCAFEYATKLFKDTTLARMAEHYKSLTKEAVFAPGRILSRLSMLTMAEKKTFLQKFNDTKV